MSQLMRAAATLASGTLASLTGVREYVKLDAIQVEFVAFVHAKEPSRSWETWQDAWNEFWPRA